MHKTIFHKVALLFLASFKISLIMIDNSWPSANEK